MGYWEATGKTDEWYTPKYVFDALDCTFDLDVAHPTHATFVPADMVLTERGLERDWTGFVWMNPPFGGRNGIVPWLEKFFDHGNGIALVPDRTSAPWFQKFAPMADAILFMSPKIKFIGADGKEGASPSTGTALFAKGERALAAFANARSLGFCCTAVRDGSDEHT